MAIGDHRLGRASERSGSATDRIAALRVGSYLRATGLPARLTRTGMSGGMGFAVPANWVECRAGLSVEPPLSDELISQPTGSLLRTQRGLTTPIPGYIGAYPATQETEGPGTVRPLAGAQL